MIFQSLQVTKYHSQLTFLCTIFHTNIDIQCNQSYAVSIINNIENTVLCISPFLLHKYFCPSLYTILHPSQLRSKITIPNCRSYSIQPLLLFLITPPSDTACISVPFRGVSTVSSQSQLHFCLTTHVSLLQKSAPF